MRRRKDRRYPKWTQKDGQAQSGWPQGGDAFDPIGAVKKALADLGLKL